MKLTEAVILNRTKQSSLDAVRNLNLWGNELSDVCVDPKGVLTLRELTPLFPSF